MSSTTKKTKPTAKKPAAKKPAVRKPVAKKATAAKKPASVKRATSKPAPKSMATRPATRAVSAKPKKRRVPYFVLIFAVAAATALLCLINFTDFKDFVLAKTYGEPIAVANLETSLALTDAGTLIFRASRPQLHTDSLGDFCDSSDISSDHSILGCYNNRIVHLYSVESAELAGIVESTAAHELLHATWERLSGQEKDRLLTLLNQIYKSNSKSLKILTDYPESTRATELYARIGTQITDLPEELEAHYAKYFTDRSKIVAYYDSYASTFAEISEAMEAVLAEVDRLAPKIDEARATYAARSAAFTSAVQEFNACAAKAGCFTDSAFRTRRAELKAEESAITALYNSLNADIAHYNELVEKYNSSLLKERKLVKIINPNLEERN